MSTLKSVIITLPAKSLAKAGSTPSLVASANLSKAGGNKLNFATPILVDKIKLENGGNRKLQNVKHMELAAVAPTANEAVIFKQENIPSMLAPAVRGKKRRLDHLTWEEKLQRKKLKNRVAAQTSRDRKKAKLDELEDSVRELRERNEQLLAECTKLRTENESLVTEVKQLKRDRELAIERKDNKDENTTTAMVCSMCQASVDCAMPTLGSAVSPIIDPLQQGGIAQKARAVTQLSQSASIILKILTLYLLSKTYLVNSKAKTTSTSSDSRSSPRALCERLPPKWKQILLSQMNRPLLWFDSQNAVEKERACEFEDTEKMVGQASSYVEADAACGGVATTTTTEQLNEIDAAQVNVLPVNVPTVTLNSSGPIEINANNVVEIKEEPMLDTEMVYGTYDEATNCITIIYPEEEVTHLTTSQPLQQQQTQQLLSPSYSYDSMSPASIHSEDTDVAMTPVTNKLTDYVQSDAGYESHGSPESSASGALTDLWQESFRELFPSLA